MNNSEGAKWTKKRRRDLLNEGPGGTTVMIKGSKKEGSEQPFREVKRNSAGSQGTDKRGGGGDGELSGEGGREFTGGNLFQNYREQACRIAAARKISRGWERERAWA